MQANLYFCKGRFSGVRPYANSKNPQHEVPQSSSGCCRGGSTVQPTYSKGTSIQSMHVDTGATTHVTFDATNLENPQAYTGTETLVVVDCKKLLISHVGGFALPSHNSSCPLKLQSVLQVLSITQNLAIKLLMRYLKGTLNFDLVYGSDHNNIGIMGYADYDFIGEFDTRRSKTGYVFMLNRNTICWKATLKSIVALSTIEAEYIACTEVVKEAVLLEGITREMGVDQRVVSPYYDSQSALCLSKNKVFHERMKHMDVRLHFIQDIISERKIKLLKVSTDDNPSNMFFKPLLTTKFRHYLNQLKIT
uniref:Polyprotein n=1 Tax=Cannabis sativa TaxID=3483 RepID=A0A803P9H4_CANSA